MCLFIASVSLVVGSFVVGIWIVNVMEKYWGEDPRAVVIDEFFGTWISVMSALFFSGTPHLFIALSTLAFVLFRIIDIRKPLGCRWIDKNIHGGNRLYVR